MCLSVLRLGKSFALRCSYLEVVAKQAASVCVCVSPTMGRLSIMDLWVVVVVVVEEEGRGSVRVK